MKTAAVIIAGGQGTRSADPSVAKIAQVIGGKSLLQWHLELLSTSSIEETILITAHLAEQVQELAQSASPPTQDLRLVREDDPRGTFPALRIATEESDADRFLVILGDVWSSFPIDQFLIAWDRSALPVAAIVHPSLHPQDSDAVLPEADGTVRVVPKAERDESTRNMSATGIFGLSRSFIESASDFTDIGSHVLRSASANGQLLPYVSSHYFKDTGTPARLQQAHNDYSSGAFARRGDLTPRPSVILDRDGVINPAMPEVYRPQDLVLNDGVAEEIAQANAQGVPVLVATNQPGLAKGFMESEDHEAIRARLDALLIEHGAFIDDYAYCPHHPESGFPGEVPGLKTSCECRKPQPGMLRLLMTNHHLDPDRTVMVGDSDRDMQAAQAAGLSFCRVAADDDAAARIRAAVETVKC